MKAGGNGLPALPPLPRTLVGGWLVLAEAIGARGACGMEARKVPRAGKGRVTHAEIDGRATAFDPGMARMITPGKECIGKAAAAAVLARLTPLDPRLQVFGPGDTARSELRQMMAFGHPRG